MHIATVSYKTDDEVTHLLRWTNDKPVVEQWVWYVVFRCTPTSACVNLFSRCPSVRLSVCSR